MSFDTTASNTGIRNGACVLIEKKLDKKLLYFACRHHFYELIISGLFQMLFGSSNSPNVGIFEKFKQQWATIDEKKYEPLEIKKNPILNKLKQETIFFLKNILTNHRQNFIRNDYRELAELCLLILGETSCLAKFKMPGPYHHARWMAKIIYSFKICLFKNQLTEVIDKENIMKFEKFSLFVSLVYVKPWLESTCASDAPFNDLQLLKSIKKYEKIDKEIADVAILKLKNHLWYLGRELILLSLFSDKVSHNEKKKMVDRVKYLGDDWSQRSIKLNFDDIDTLEKTNLSSLVTCCSISALKNFNIDVKFIFEEDPENWKNLSCYQYSKQVIDSINVVNDVAERSVALTTQYNDSLTKNETEKQNILQIVSDHRQKFSSKKT